MDKYISSNYLFNLKTDTDMKLTTSVKFTKRLRRDTKYISSHFNDKKNVDLTKTTSDKTQVTSHLRRIVQSKTMGKTAH